MFEEVLEDFLAERLAMRLASEKDERKAEALRKKFKTSTWLEYAADKMRLIGITTHVAKFTHTGIKSATDILAEDFFVDDQCLLGTHALGESQVYDLATGNAANLDKDISAFFKVKYRGKTVAEHIVKDDVEFRHELTALCSSAAYFYAAKDSLHALSSHTLAKQVCWLVGSDPKNDSEYHILAPLYATSLAHHVYQILQEDRFGEAAKEARKARREKRYSEHGYRDYPGLAVQKLGGTKPQNISQLNSERGGRNYLLSSCPPAWEDQGLKPPLHTDSVFLRFAQRSHVKWLIRQLRSFLEQNPPSTAATRDRRDALTDAIIDELVIFAAQIRTLPPGWSDTPECRLHVSEVLWLDAHRCETDAEFAAARERGDWCDEVAARFGNWLNHTLQKKLSLGDVEWSHWRSYLAGKLDALHEDLTYE